MDIYDKYNLKWLLGNISEEHFIKDYWEESPIYLPFVNDANTVALFTLKDMEEILFSNMVNPDNLSIFTQQKLNRNLDDFFDGNGKLKASRIYDAYVRQGSTICLQYPEYSCPAIQRLCQSISKIFYADVITSLFLSPPHSVGLNVHFDYYNAFIVQLSGKKRWRLYDFVIESPSREKDRIKLEKEKLGEPILDVLMNEGDILYVPRGMPHEPVCEDSHSLHLTIGIKTHVWADVLQQSIDKLRDNHAFLRKSLPPFMTLKNNIEAYEGTFRKVMDYVKNNAGIEDFVAEIEETFYLNRPITVENPLDYIIGFKPVTISSYLIHHNDLAPIVKRRSDDVEIFFSGAKLKGPLSIADALDFIANNQSFVLCDICQNLSDEAKITLASKLVNMGLLQVTDGDIGVDVSDQSRNLNRINRKTKIKTETSMMLNIHKFEVSD